MRRKRCISYVLTITTAKISSRLGSSGGGSSTTWRASELGSLDSTSMTDGSDSDDLGRGEGGRLEERVRLWGERKPKLEKERVFFGAEDLCLRESVAVGVREEEKKASVAEAIPCLLWPQSPLLSTSIPCCWLRFQAYPILLFFFFYYFLTYHMSLHFLI